MSNLNKYSYYLRKELVSAPVYHTIRIDKMTIWYHSLEEQVWKHIMESLTMNQIF